MGALIEPPAPTTTTRNRARMLVDRSQPLISGCYLPLYGNEMVWIYFRYEGVFNFCKTCGRVGHYTLGCPDSDEDAQRKIRHRIQCLEAQGQHVLYGHVTQDFCSNMIEALPNRFQFRTPRMNVYQQPTQDDYPLRNPHHDSLDEDGSRLSVDEPQIHGIEEQLYSSEDDFPDEGIHHQEECNHHYNLTCN